MRLLMAVSSDGYLCRGPDDNMKWTGAADKRIFRSLTSVGGNMYAGSRTYALLEGLALDGRILECITTKEGQGLTLREMYHRELKVRKEGWLIGGPTVAYEALTFGFVSEVHIVSAPVCLGSGMSVSSICRVLEGPDFTHAMNVTYEKTSVHHVWRHV